MRVWPAGIGETTGDALVLSTYLATKTSVEVIFVDSITGNDSFHGLDRLAPKATLGAGITAAGAGGVVVLLSTHDETLTATQTLSSDGLTIVGAGLVAGKPTAKLRMNAAALALFSITGIGVELRNIWFPENVQANSASKITVGETHARIIGCYFEQGPKDNGAAVDLVAGWQYAEFLNTTFISTATAASDLPPFAVRALASGDGLWMDGVVFDGGPFGFANNRGYNDTGGPVGLHMERMSQLRGADINTTANGWIQTMTATGGARVGE